MTHVVRHHLNRIRRKLLTLTVTGSLLTLPGCESGAPPDPAVTEGDGDLGAPAVYVGSAACADCHEAQYDLWTGSQHDLAMQPATAETVLADFDGATFDYHGIRSVFYKQNNRFMVRIDDANGAMADYEITHTFGVNPLQQYLVTFPDGRKQAVSIAWDARPAESNGQRWFHLYPDEIVTHGDPVHWTGRNQNWNYMCADCHSTDLQKNFDLDANRYDTQWAEIDVSCEACHGPASHHVAWAENPGAHESPDPGKGRLNQVSTAEDEIGRCARCHARRSIIAEGYAPGERFLDYYLPALLDAGLYHVDGQILEEVYVYGSFLQSRMYQHGVRCTDCHEPHSADLIVEENALCTRCHREQPPEFYPTLNAKNYDSTGHDFHPQGSTAPKCVACHMPSRHYMVIDERHDHSFRIPRPDLTVKLGVPNACNACHADRSAEWAEKQVMEWYGNRRPDHFAGIFHDGRRGLMAAEEPLSKLATDTNQPAVVRATALQLLQRYRRATSADAIAIGMRDMHPLVRIGALRGAQRMNLEIRWQLANPLLTDELRAVRIEAARVLAAAVPAARNHSRRDALARAIDEYIAAQKVNADRPEAHTNLGLLHAEMGEFAEAEKAYLTALALEAAWAPALVNLADLYSATERDEAGGGLLKRAIAAAPQSGAVHHAYGLWLTRRGRREEAIAFLQRATELDRDNPRFAYVYGVALNSVGEASNAIQILTGAQKHFPEDIDILYALATIHRDRNDHENALIYARILTELRPYESAFVRLLNELQATHNP